MQQVFKEVEEHLNHIFTKAGLILKHIHVFSDYLKLSLKGSHLWFCNLVYFSGMALTPDGVCHHFL